MDESKDNEKVGFIPSHGLSLFLSLSLLHSLSFSYSLSFIILRKLVTVTNGENLISESYLKAFLSQLLTLSYSFVGINI